MQKTIQNAVNADRLIGISEFLSGDRILDLINEYIILFFRAQNALTDVSGEFGRIPVWRIHIIIQSQSDDMILFYSAVQKILSEDFKQNCAFSASAQAADDFDSAVPLLFNQLIQIVFSFCEHHDHPLSEFIIHKNFRNFPANASNFRKVT